MQKSGERGNAVVFILLAVALFGALSYTFMSGSKSGTGNLTSNQARLAAQEIINYGISVQRAVDKLRTRGCSENEISFAHTRLSADYENALAPPDFTCHVFNTKGGGINQPLLSKDLFKVVSNYSEYTGKSNINGLGSSNAELMWVFEFPPETNRKELCDAINRLLDISSTPVAGVNAGPKYNGVFPASATLTSALDNTEAVCINYTADTARYFYYQVLLIR